MWVVVGFADNLIFGVVGLTVNLTLIMLWANSADQQTDDIFLRRQFAWSVKPYFLGKIRKIFQNVVCWNFYPACKALISWLTSGTALTHLSAAIACYKLIIFIPIITESLEDRVEHYAKKRKLNSGEAEPVATTSETDWAACPTWLPCRPYRNCSEEALSFCSVYS